MGVQSTSKRKAGPKIHKTPQRKSDSSHSSLGLTTKNGRCGAYVPVQGGGFICSHPSGIHLNGKYCDGYPGDCNVFPKSLESLLKPHEPYKGPGTARQAYLAVRKCDEVWHHVKLRYIPDKELPKDLRPICLHCRSIVSRVERIIRKRKK